MLRTAAWIKLTPFLTGMMNVKMGIFESL